ncbi:unnamed protein product [Rangifer tarandus platyrhynchus]|uniref:Uncharacterized protein n=1 Tax=Rangifer tarandus platyrhynchus TaxID=3082113 RepID=A0AC59YEM6_RANTA
MGHKALVVVQKLRPGRDLPRSPPLPTHSQPSSRRWSWALFYHQHSHLALPPSTKPTQPAILRAPPTVPDFLRGLAKLTAFPPSAPSILRPFSASHPLGPTPNPVTVSQDSQKDKILSVWLVGWGVILSLPPQFWKP